MSIEAIREALEDLSAATSFVSMKSRDRAGKTCDKLRQAIGEYGALLQRLDEAQAELEALRRGEFICGKCGLRKNSEAGPAPF